MDHRIPDTASHFPSLITMAERASEHLSVAEEFFFFVFIIIYRGSYKEVILQQVVSYPIRESSSKTKVRYSSMHLRAEVGERAEDPRIRI